MFRLYKVLSLSLLALSSSFHLQVTRRPRKLSRLVTAAQKNISGSFFNPVPQRDDEDKDNTSIEGTNHSSSQHINELSSGMSVPAIPMDPFDQSLAELLKKKRDSNHPSSSSVDRGLKSAKAIGKKIYLFVFVIFILLFSNQTVQRFRKGERNSRNQRH